MSECWAAYFFLLFAGAVGGAACAATLGGASSSSGLHSGVLHIGASDGASLEACIEAFTVPELVEDLECPKCTAITRMQELTNTNNLLEQTMLTLGQLGPLGQDSGPLGAGFTTAEIQRNKQEIQWLQNIVQGASGRTTSLDDGPGGCSARFVGVPMSRSRATKQHVFSQLPQALCFHLGRRHFCPMSGRMTKLRQHVQFPVHLDMTPFSAYGGDSAHAVSVSEATASPAVARAPPSPHRPAVQPTAPALPHFQYRLCSVIVHHGSSEVGHYTTYRRLAAPPSVAAAADRWVHISDEHVRPARLDEVLDSEAYMLFYSKTVPQAQM